LQDAVEDLRTQLEAKKIESNTLQKNVLELSFAGT
jgi:hypothetical protein